MKWTWRIGWLGIVAALIWWLGFWRAILLLVILGIIIFIFMILSMQDDETPYTQGDM